MPLTSVCPRKDRRTELRGTELYLRRAKKRIQKRDRPASRQDRGSDRKGNISVTAPANAGNTSNLHTDPLIHHGRHFGRAVYAFANLHALIMFGLSADEDAPPETQQLRFLSLVSLIPLLILCSEKEGS